MNVAIKRCVRQVVYGIHYEGSIEVNGTKFGFELRFHTPIHYFMVGKIGKNDCQLKISRGIQEVDLSEKAHEVMLLMLIDIVVSFYTCELDRIHNIIPCDTIPTRYLHVGITVMAECTLTDEQFQALTFTMGATEHLEFHGAT